MQFYMSKKSLFWRKAAAVLSVLAVLLAMVVVSPVETRADGDQSVTLDLVVLYNDTEHNYYDSAVGDQVEITGPGTYTVTFDCAEDLQAEQTDAGITGLSNLTAIYLIDDLYLTGQSLASDVDAFELKYDSIVLDGTELELSNHDENSGIKSSGQIDTNGPINGWENCQLVDSAYTVDTNHCLNFVDFENPQVIEITFTVTNIVFKEATTEAPEETTEETTEEETEEVTEATTEAVTEADTEAATETAAETTEAATEATSDATGSGSMVRTIVIIVLVILLIVVIVLVVKKLKN
jgi:hypothetical protein